MIIFFFRGLSMMISWLVLHFSGGHALYTAQGVEGDPFWGA